MRYFIGAWLLVYLFPVLGLAQGMPPQPPQQQGSAEILRQIGIDQKLDAPIPLDLSFRDETGKDVRLNTYFTDKPVIIAPVYYECPMLCTMVLNGLVKGLSEVPFTPGKDFTVLAISIDPREKPFLAAAKKALYLKRFPKRGTENGWHFLTGQEAEIRQLTQAIGFRYAWDTKLQQYAHASGIMVATPQGRLSRYFYGVDYLSKDLRLGLVEASQNHIGSPVDKVLLYCFHYDPVMGKYTPIAMAAVRVGAAVTIVGLGSLIYLLIRWDRRTHSKKRAG